MKALRTGLAIAIDRARNTVGFELTGFVDGYYIEGLGVNNPSM
jgi:hypothetical protein